jgi:hypothetical protein
MNFTGKPAAVWWRAFLMYNNNDITRNAQFLNGWRVDLQPVLSLTHPYKFLVTFPELTFKTPNYDIPRQRH